MPLFSNPFATRYTRPGEIPYRFFGEGESSAGHHNTEVGRVRHRGAFPIRSQHDFEARDGEKRVEGNGKPLRMAKTKTFEHSEDLAPQTLDRERSKIADVRPHDLDMVLDRMVRGQAHLIVGPHGTGKTTLLHSLLTPLNCSYQSCCLLRLDGAFGRGLQRWTHAIRSGRIVLSAMVRLPRGSLLILDGLEQLGPMARGALLIFAKVKFVTLLGTSHRSIFGMKVIHKTAINPRLILELTDHLLRDVPHGIRSEVEGWISSYDLQHVSNLREFWFELYDFVQPKLAESPCMPAARQPLDG